MPYRLCRHIKTNGLQCQSPAMVEQRFCFYHHTSRQRHRAVAARDPSPAALANMGTITYAPTLDRSGNFSMEPLPALTPDSTSIDLGPLDDAHSVQLAISVVVNALARTGSKCAAPPPCSTACNSPAGNRRNSCANPSPTATASPSPAPVYSTVRSRTSRKMTVTPTRTPKMPQIQKPSNTEAAESNAGSKESSATPEPDSMGPEQNSAS